MNLLLLSIALNTVLVSGSSLSDKVKQTPADIYKKPGEEARISCSHSIDNYYAILWITMKTDVLIIFVVLALWLQVHCQDVTQHPAISWNYVSKSAEMNCSHNKDISHTQMYWYRQRPGETMTLIVYTVYKGKPDYGGFPQAKYEAIKDTIQTGALTVKNLQPEDSGVSLGLEVRQSHSDLIIKPGDKVQIFCSHDKTDYRVMLWYQRSPGDTALKLIGYLNFKDVKMEKPYDKDFSISGDLSGNTAKNGSLILNLAAQEHSAVYYCAARETL
ncbi:uncharacterized protein AKAME5_000180200 [Lates japonicus]|uniref:Ig-like domain-containing protein n=1 Tax=Lates japonicus TaxID=270547 RepID=A0AAD3QWR8_LATJO|nr:uncharacterized protein AKAME5_000180200 [Lates japonicus]